MKLLKQQKEVALEENNFQEIKKEKENIIWNSLKDKNVTDAVLEYLDSLKNKTTRKNYLSGFNMLLKVGLLNPELSLQSFSLTEHDLIIDKIKSLEGFSEATKQTRAGLYISFTKFLSRKYKNIFTPATPNKAARTFHKIREQVSTPAMSLKQCHDFLDELGKVNKRDQLIAKLQLAGGKRISEVLSLEIEKINWAKGKIEFKQLKTKGTDKITIIDYSDQIMTELKNYLGERKNGITFITGKGKAVRYTQIQRNYKKAGEIANIPFSISSHVLRASAVTLYLNSGYQAEQVAKITGHSLQMLIAYDKSRLSDNPTEKWHIV